MGISLSRKEVSRMAPTWKEIQHICTVCHGTGEVTPPHDSGSSPPVPVDCPICLGEGYLEWGREKVE